MSSFRLPRALSAFLGVLIGLILVPQASAIEAYARPEFRAKLESFRESPSSLIGLEIWDVGPAKDDLNSQFGHVLFRFVDDDGDDFNDLILNYYPVFPEGRDGALEALFPVYDLGLELNSAKHFMEMYPLGESRVIRRILVLSNSDLRKAFVESTHENLYSQESRGKYAGLGNNCLGAVLRSFEAAGFPRVGPMAFLPAGAHNYLNRVGLAPFPRIETEVAERVQEELLTKSKSVEEAIPLGNATSKITTQEAWRILFYIPYSHRSRPLQSFLLEKVWGDVDGISKRDEALRIKKLAPQAYQICTDSNCAEESFKALKEVLGPKNRKQSLHEAIDFDFSKTQRRLRPQDRSSSFAHKTAEERTLWRGLKSSIEGHYKLLQKQHRLDRNL